MSRYKILLPREQQDIVLASEEQTRAAVKQLLAVFKVPEGQYEMGRTKVFFKPGVWGGCGGGVPRRMLGGRALCWLLWGGVAYCSMCVSMTNKDLSAKASSRLDAACSSLRSPGCLTLLLFVAAVCVCVCACLLQVCWAMSRTPGPRCTPAC